MCIHEYYGTTLYQGSGSSPRVWSMHFRKQYGEYCSCQECIFMSTIDTETPGSPRVWSTAGSIITSPMYVIQ